MLLSSDDHSWKIAAVKLLPDINIMYAIKIDY